MISPVTRVIAKNTNHGAAIQAVRDIGLKHGGILIIG